jgi:hypothetical protein
MTNFKILLLYIVSLISLFMFFGYIHPGEPAQLESLPSPIPSATPLPRPEPFPGAARFVRCQDLSKPNFFFYTPAITTASEKRLTISGTVYTSNLTPLPNALVELWQGDINQVNYSYPLIIFRGRLRTDEAGHYEFTTTKFTLSAPSYLKYRVTYRDYCPLEMYLHLVVEPLSKPAEHIVAKVQVVGPVLHGSVDIVLPVPPPVP